MVRPKGEQASQTHRVKHPDPNWMQRCALAIELSTGHRMSWDEVAQRAGYASRGAAYAAVHRELKRRNTDAVDAKRAVESAMLDLLQGRVWPLAVPDMESSKETSLWAVDRVLAISKARRDLWGLDTPPPDEIASQNVRRVYERRAG